tara:strand:+ start:202 stop:387 length:186 start_codon:yes stop_codon:yes gene_type:complete
MEEQLEFDWNEYENMRNQSIVDNLPPRIGEELSLVHMIESELKQERYYDFLKRMTKNDRET